MFSVKEILKYMAKNRMLFGVSIFLVMFYIGCGVSMFILGNPRILGCLGWLIALFWLVKYVFSNAENNLVLITIAKLFGDKLEEKKDESQG